MSVDLLIRAVRRPTAVLLVVVTYLLVSVSLAAAAETDPAASPNQGSDYHPGMATLFLALALLAIALGLLFSYGYHTKLLAAIPKIMVVAGGTKVSTSDNETMATAMGGDLQVEAPSKVAKNSKAAFKALNSQGRQVTWEAAGASPEPVSGTGLTFDVTFKAAGPATVTAKADTASYAVAFEVVEEATPVGGIILPFAIRNWGRFVVTVLGVGVIAALMALGIVSAEGGIGILGALLGVGAASATADPAAEPKPANPPGAN